MSSSRLEVKARGGQESRRRASLPYRPALDGLRAIAVIAVFIYHARPTWLPGGWLGVDAFFVLSGFLITSLLLREHHLWGWISFARFWMARVRRLLPAVCLLLLAVLSVSFFWVPVGRREATSLDAVATAFYYANWRLLFSNEAYFAAVANPSVLRHTWSLAVEEQFYIVYPLLIALLLRLTGRRHLAKWLGLLAGGSVLLMASLHEPGLDPSRVYYGTDSRAHELFVGAIAAALLTKGATNSPGLRLWLDRWCRRFAWPAIAVLLAAFVTVTEAADWVFRGGLLAFSLVVVVVVIAGASPNANPVARFLALEPLRVIGLVSYGLYLWHWPVLMFLNADRISLPGPILLAVQAGMTGLLATMSYRIVEQPIRRRGLRALVPGRPAAGRMLAVATVLALAALAIALPNSRYGSRLSGEGSDLQWNAPTYHPRSESVDIALVGNSIPYSLYLAFPRETLSDLTVAEFTNFGCDLMPYARVVDGATLPDTGQCVEWRATLESRLREKAPDLTVMFISQAMLNDHEVGGRHVTFGTQEHDLLLARSWRDQLRQVEGIPVVLVNLACHRMPDLGNNEEVRRTNDDTRVEHLNRLLAAWGEKHDVKVIDQYGFLCRGGYHDTLNGYPLYDDGLHFTPESGSIVWEWLAPQLREAAEMSP